MSIPHLSHMYGKANTLDTLTQPAQHSFPLHRDQQHRQVHSSHAAAGYGQHLADTREEQSPARATILSVDDNDDLRYVMALTLGMMGFDVLSCSDAEAASSEFRSRRDVDLLITDLEMPGRSGAALPRELCSLPPSLPVLIVSGAYISPELTREMGERNWQFLAKPYSLPAFSANICALLGARTGQRQAA